MKRLLPTVLLAFLLSCQAAPEPSTPTRAAAVEATAREYFATFAERTDWEKLCAFYREDLEFEDVLLQIKLDSLWKFKRFYRWDEEGDRFRKLSPDQEHLSVASLVVSDSVAVARGRVNPFYYDDNLIDTDWGMDFTIWLYFDDQLKIRRQVDWFEYDAPVLRAMLERVDRIGHETPPEWLDLTPP